MAKSPVAIIYGPDEAGTTFTAAEVDAAGRLCVRLIDTNGKPLEQLKDGRYLLGVRSEEIEGLLSDILEVQTKILEANRQMLEVLNNMGDK